MSSMGLCMYEFWLKEFLHLKASISSSHKQKVEKQLNVCWGWGPWWAQKQEGQLLRDQCEHSYVMGEGHQAFWNMLLSAAQRKRLPQREGGFRALWSDMGAYGEPGGKKIFPKVSSIESLDFAATLWTELEGQGCDGPWPKIDTHSLALFASRETGGMEQERLNHHKARPPRFCQYLYMFLE